MSFIAGPIHVQVTAACVLLFTLFWWSL